MQRELKSAAQAARFGRFQIEADDRPNTGRTDWHAIALFYDRLIQLSPMLGARVGRPAVAALKGAASGLALLDAIKAQLVAYQPYWAVRGHLLKALN